MTYHLFEFKLIAFNITARLRFGTGRQLYDKLGGKDQTGGYRIRRGGGSCPRRRIARLSGSSSGRWRPELARRLPHGQSPYPRLIYPRLALLTIMITLCPNS
jgi:hypothetical protein